MESVGIRECQHIDVVNENGYNICCSCGTCVNEHYFLNDILSIAKRNGYNVSEPNKSDKINNNKKVIFYQKKWVRLRRIEYIFSGIQPNIVSKIQILLNLLTGYLSLREIEKLSLYLKEISFKNVKQVYIAVFDYIYTFDLSITTKELISLMKIDYDRKTFNLYKDLNCLNKIRKYYWYISKRLSGFRLPNEKKQAFNKSVKQYYDIIRFGLKLSANPINLINYIIYEMLNQHCKDTILKKHRTIPILGISSSFVVQYKKHLTKITDLNLDNNIEYKLTA